MNVEAMEVRIAPAHSDLNGVVEISDSLIAAQQNAAPDHRAHAPQNHLELVGADFTRFGHRSFIVFPALLILKALTERSARLFMLSH